jgi:glycine/serine hydroxymethyltransferase
LRIISGRTESHVMLDLRAKKIAGMEAENVGADRKLSHI